MAHPFVDKGLVTLWPLTVLGLVQAFLIAWLILDVVADNPGVSLPTKPTAHGHAGGLTGPAPVASEAMPHYLGLAAFAVHVLLVTLAAAVVVTQRLVKRWGLRPDSLAGWLVFALVAGASGAVTGVGTGWLALHTTATTETTALPAVVAIGATTAFRYSFLLALVFAALGGTKWMSIGVVRQEVPAPMPDERL